MEEKAFKKLLIDLELTLSEIGRRVGVSHWAVGLYFRGQLRAETTRKAIKRVLRERAREKGIQLPKFWEDVAA